MAWAFSVSGTAPTATQSGTDSGLASLGTAINAQATVARSTAYAVGAIVKPPTATGMWYRCSTAGTTAASAPTYNATSGSTTTDGTSVFTAFVAPLIVNIGDSNSYVCPAFLFHITGELTVPDPGKETYTAWAVRVLSGGNYTSGTFCTDGVTPKTGGLHFTAVGLSAQFNRANNTGSLEVQSGGQYRFIGGTYYVGGGICYMSGAINIEEFGVSAVASRAFGASSARIFYGTPNVSKTDCEHYDLGIDLFQKPTAGRPFTVKAFGAEYVSQYVGSGNGGSNAKFVASALSNQDGTYDFDNYDAGWIELYDCVLGANLKVVCQANRVQHCVPLYQNINFTVTDLLTVPQQSVRFICTDAPVINSPTTTITTLDSLKTWDFRNARVYTGETNASGQVSAAPVLQVWHGSSNLKNLRFPASTATFQWVGYRVRQQAVPIVLGSDTPITRGVALVSATNLTMTEAEAAAITGVSFVPSGPSGGTFTNTGAKTASQIWHAWRYWKGLTANAGSADSWEFDGETLNMGAWSVAGGAITGNFTTTGTITAPVIGTYTDANNAGQIVVTGPAATDTVEMRRASDNSLIATRTGPGAFAVSPANVGVSVYFERKVGAVLVMSTQTTPVTLSTVNEDVPMFAGPQVAVANIDGVAKETTLQALATTNQTEHDATQAAIAAIPPVNLTPVLTAVDALPTLAEMEGSWKLTNGGLIDLGTLTYWETSTGSTKFDFFIRYRDGLTTTTGLTAKVSYSNTTQPVEDQLSIFARTGGFAILGAISSDFGQESISVPELVISLNGVPIARGNCIPGGPTMRDIEASTVLAKKSDITALPAPLNATQTQAAAAAALVAYDAVVPADLAGLATSANVTAAQVAIIAEVDAIPTNPLLTTDTRLNNLDAAISTRSTLTAPQVRAELATELGRLDVAVGTRLSASAYVAPTTPPTAADNAAAVRTNLTTELARIDATVSSRLATTGYTAPANADIAAIKAKTDTLVNGPTLANIEASTILAKEATVSTRASQTSVNAIPTNPLLTNDARLNNLDATVSSRLASSAYVAAPTLASIRADIERTGGMLDTVPTLAEVEASTVLAKQSGFTGLATATNVSNAQTAIVGEINANEVKIDLVKADTAAIKAKTDTLVNTVAPTAAQIRTELETSGSKLDTAAKKSKAAWVNTL